MPLVAAVCHVCRDCISWYVYGVVIQFIGWLMLLLVVQSVLGVASFDSLDADTSIHVFVMTKTIKQVMPLDLSLSLASSIVGGYNC